MSSSDIAGKKISIYFSKRHLLKRHVGCVGDKWHAHVNPMTQDSTRRMRYSTCLNSLSSPSVSRAIVAEKEAIRFASPVPKCREPETWAQRTGKFARWQFSVARKALSDARTLDDILKIRDKAEAARTYAKVAKLSLEIQNEAAVIKLEAERKAGAVQAGTEKNKEQIRCHWAPKQGQ